ncbi:hypothetical protein PC118_g18485 [Phytophthora cactorum]|uniref:Uncharacterized protein n=1 Tax=Phytophthora cactorum TaxID=29920 RepID=A0A8T1F4S2_9STRA|nr:hypothetical protein PC118_g18485 [Phytophthora cactorum]KAG4041038.1 hypothetical protein PC123_g23436 [Phytophthora cactorum]
MIAAVAVISVTVIATATTTPPASCTSSPHSPLLKWLGNVA